MFSPSKAILIVGVILIALLIMSVSMYVYNSAASTISDSMASFSTQEIEAFNNNFESYGGNQTGANIKALTTRLSANAKTYYDEPEKVPSFYFEKDDISVEYDSDQDDYIDSLTKIRNDITPTDMYNVTFTYRPSGLIETIKVSYVSSKDDSDNDYDYGSDNYYGDTRTVGFSSLDKIEEYKGNQTGSNVSVLLSKLEVTAKTNYNTEGMIPSIYYGKDDKLIEFDFDNKEASLNSYTKEIESIKDVIENKHTYWIELSYQDSGEVDTISILYEKPNQ